MNDLKDRLRARARTSLRHHAELAEHRGAAVLVPILRGDALLFTQRTTTLSQHSGQISFPGGRADASDRDAAATALREAEEEIGLPPASVEVLGELDEIPTPTGYLITPVVGLVAEPPATWRPNPAEVAEVFTVEIARLRDPAVLERGGQIERWGVVWELIAYHVDGRRIWGATARMVSILLELLP
jgi:8-oxo-dGTP pyrophosphatase MutT (NUDIX family)